MKRTRLWSSDGLINEIANHNWAVYEHSAKARLLLSNGCWGRREAGTSWSWEDVCAESACCHCVFQGTCWAWTTTVLLSVAAFKVHFTSLSRYWSPCAAPRSSRFPSVVWQVFCFCLCRRVQYVPVRLKHHSTCEYMCIHTPPSVLGSCSRVCSAAATGMSPFWDLFVSACVNIYKCLQWAQPRREWSRANQFSSGCAFLLPLGWAVIFKLFYNGSL